MRRSTANPPAHIMRATPKRLVKSLFLCSVMGFLVINLNLFLRADVTDDPELSESAQSPLPAAAADGAAFDVIVPHVTGRFLPHLHNPNDTFRRFINNSAPVADRVPAAELAPVGVWNNSRYDLRDLLTYIPIGTDPTTIKEYIHAVNSAQPIRNLDKFDLSPSAETVVILVQVHNRDEYLTALIDSLRKAKYIEQALLIFSHDYFDDRLNQIIAQVDFCPTMQIFYPNSIQLHPHEYPGEDPDDCPRDANREEAVKIGCINAHWPDKYGHYREAKYTQTKHHWFWKLNHVFDWLEVTKHHNGPVLLLEEDHYVAPDFIHVLWKMYRFKNQACKECSIFTIGSYDKHPQYGTSNRGSLWSWMFGQNEESPKVDCVEILNWHSSKHNMGMALNREVWDKIKKCTDVFCRFDDYNWDWSLQHISMTCIPDKLRVMVVKSPRVFHIGECGVHHKNKKGNCHPTEKVHQIDMLLSNSAASLFPDALTIHGFPKSINRKLKPNGGWGDQRDHEMCVRFTQPDDHR